MAGFHEFVERVAPWFDTEEFTTQVMMSALGAVGDRGIDRLMILGGEKMRGKTVLAAQLLPAYVLGERPDENVIIATWSGEASAQSLGSVRAIVDGDDFGRLYPEVRPEPTTEHDYKWWGVEGRRGRVLQTGVGGALSGHMAGLIVLDTPYRSRVDYESERIRRSIEMWYRGTLRCRLQPGGALVIVSPRYGADDLCSVLLKQDGSRWEFVEVE